MILTPIRQQYLKIKHQYPEAIVFFRLGDFYETFDEDARVTSRELEITLTSREIGRGRRVPMAGIPYHALDNYLARLIGRGYKVAICEQLSPPGKGLVEREVVRVVTPGTVIEPALLEGKTNNYLVGVVAEGNQIGVAYADITTGEFTVTQLTGEQLLPELERLNPAEVIVPEGREVPELSALPFFTSTVRGWQPEDAPKSLREHFGVSSLEGYGCAALPRAIEAASLVLSYLQQTQQGVMGLLDTLYTYSTADYMTLDNQTRHNLELFQSSHSRDTSGSLLAVIDLTQTPMGGRLLRRWLGQPLLDIVELKRRQDAVAAMYENALVRRTIMELLKKVADLERLVNRIGNGYAGPKELVSLRRSLEIVPQIHEVLTEAGTIRISWLINKPASPRDITGLIAQAMVNNPSSSWGEGEIIREGFHPELDELRSTLKEARSYLAGLERHERERTGIRSLKIGYNKVFGYYLEVSKSNLTHVPEDYIRKQTLTEAERFFTPELKECEALILNAQERMSELERAAFREVCHQVSEQAAHIISVAEMVALLDVFCSLAEVAARYRYVCPELNEGDEIISDNA